jgi:predicted amidohydrolase YtcJ
LGPVKVLLDDALPPATALESVVRSAHAEGRPVAFHAVTRVQLIAAVLAVEAAGSRPGDRVEHGAVIPDELVESLRALQLTVVTQPSFVADRGDRYLADVDADDLSLLYRVRSLLAAGVAVAAGSDAPFGHPDPWRAVTAAVSRRTEAGAVLGPEERVEPGAALGLFLGRPDLPGERRRIGPGAPADVCVLRCPLAAALDRPTAENVRATVAAGRVLFDSPP